MVRECVVGLVLVPITGCSLILDFSPSAIPIDAATDAPYTQDECEYKEPNDSPDTAAMLDQTEVGPAAICAGDPEDHDFYKFTVPPSTSSVSVRITFVNRPTGDIDLRLFDKTGAMLRAQSRGFTDQETIVCPATSPPCAALVPDDYVFEVFPALPGTVNRYDMALVITPM